MAKGLAPLVELEVLVIPNSRKSPPRDFREKLREKFRAKIDPQPRSRSFKEPTPKHLTAHLLAK